MAARFPPTAPTAQRQPRRRRKAVEGRLPGPPPCHLFINEGTTLRKPPRASPRNAQRQPASARDIANSARRRGRRTAAAVRRRKAQPASVGHSNAGGAGGAGSGVSGQARQIAAPRGVSGPWAGDAVAQHTTKNNTRGTPRRREHNATPQRFSSKQHPTDRACSAAPGPSPTSPRQRPHPPNQGQGQGRAHLGHPPPPPQ